MLIPLTVPNLMKFGFYGLQQRWGIGKGDTFFFWQWHHLLILLLWGIVLFNKPRSNITLYLQACVINDFRRLELCSQNHWRNTDGISGFFLFLFSSNRFVPDVWILIISLGLSSRHTIDFCLMGEKRVRLHLSNGIYRKCFASPSKSVKAGPEIPNFQMSLWVILCSGPNFYLPVIDRLENSFVKTCGRILNVESPNELNLSFAHQFRAWLISKLLQKAS